MAGISVDVLAVIGLAHHFLPFCTPLFTGIPPPPPHPPFWLMNESKKLQEK